ncbi:MAG: transposase family protein [Candidatus Anammoximicrobium sp.]|nr:transposase family protein [Candidatus Anammoximicrobium sp.]
MGAPIVSSEGRRQRCYVLRVVLSHSRKAYSVVVERQSTENFVRALESAFQAFGGVPKTLVIDNLRAAVKRADWFEPELNPKVRAFAAHCGVAADALRLQQSLQLWGTIPTRRDHAVDTQMCPYTNFWPAGPGVGL